MKLGFRMVRASGVKLRTNSVLARAHDLCGNRHFQEFQDSFPVRCVRATKMRVSEIPPSTYHRAFRESVPLSGRNRISEAVF